MAGGSSQRDSQGQRHDHLHVNEWVQAHPASAEAGYHILCFDNLSSARDFSCISSYDEVWLCEIEGRISPLPLMRYMHHVEEGNFHGPGLESWPRDTIMAKRVKLIRRVA